MGFEWNTPKHLVDLFDQQPVRRTLIDLAEAGRDRMLDLTVRNTPIGGRDLIGGPGAGGGQGGGNLRSSWRGTAVFIRSEGGERVYSANVETDVSYADEVEHGWGKWGPTGAPYEIRAKPGKWLSWITREAITLRDGTVVAPGTRIFRKRVMHPGAPGAHMVAVAAATTEAELERIAEPILERWTRRQEG